MSRLTVSPCSDRLHLIAGPDIRAFIVVDDDGLVRAADRPVAGWALYRPLSQVVRRAELRGATVTLLPDDPAATGQHPVLPAQRAGEELVPA